ncbi:PIG-L family deacetylase [bacterium]|nr:PIG-L family deacetylase [bacterium]
MIERVLVIAVHPDDETLGCGGTLLRHRAQGDEIHWGIVTCMNPATTAADRIKARAAEIEAVSIEFGFSSVIQMGIPTTEVDRLSDSERVRRFSELIASIQPTVVYLPFCYDAHSDHRVVFDAVYSCTKSFRYPSVKQVYMMEVTSETDFHIPTGTAFQPNVWVDISPYFQKKLEIMGIFKSELGEHPFPRSLTNIEAWAHIRGAQAGCTYAESFMLLKQIII